MATKNSAAAVAEEEVVTPANALATVRANEVAVTEDSGMDDLLADYAGAGMEGATEESFATPFLSVLQKGSPQVDQDSGAAIPGAKAGSIYENVTGRLYDGKEGVLIVPCAYNRVYLRWRPRGAEGAGFKGQFTPERIAAMRANGTIVEQEGRLYAPLPDGTVNEKRCDRFADTRNHYIFLLDSDGGWTQCLLSLTSTQIKKSRQLFTMLQNIKLKHPTKGLVPAPTYANIVRMTTVPESNDQGTWHGVKFELVGRVPEDRKDIIRAAIAFNKSVVQGQVEVKYEDPMGGDEEVRSGGSDGF